MCSPLISGSSCLLSSNVSTPQYTVFLVPAVNASNTLHKSQFLHDHHYLSPRYASSLDSSFVSVPNHCWSDLSWAVYVATSRCYDPSNLHLLTLNRNWNESNPLQACNCQLWRSSMRLKMRWLASKKDQISKTRASRRPPKQEKKEGTYTMKFSGRYEKIHQAHNKTQKLLKIMLTLAPMAWLSPTRPTQALSLSWRRRPSNRWQTWTPVTYLIEVYLCCFLFKFAQKGLRPPFLSYLGINEAICYRYHQAVEKKWTLKTSLTQNLGLTIC